jgi:hypothetical protein
MLTLPSMTATHEFVVPKSIPMISFPARAAAEALGKDFLKKNVTE